MQIAVATAKGGTGKSTICLSIASELALKGKKVALVDLDPGQTLLYWEWAREQYREESRSPAYGLPFPEVIDQTHGFKGVPGGFDATVLDTPGASDRELIKVLDACDLALVPVRPSGPDVYGALHTVEVIKERQAERPDLKAAFVISQDDPRTTEDITPELKSLGLKILKSRLSHRVDYRRAYALGLSVVHYRPGSASADEVRALTREVSRIRR